MIDAQVLAKSYQCPLSRASKWVGVINHAMEKYSINTPLRIAHFLAQIGHESGRLIYVQELASGKAYDNRADLGNTKPEAVAIAKANKTTPGVFWKGHGLIQLTGYDNHVWMSKALGIDCVNHPEKLMEYENAALSAGEFWNKKNLNAKADMDLLTQITRAINGGTNGIEDRLLMLGLAKQALGI